MSEPRESHPTIEPGRATTDGLFVSLVIPVRNEAPTLGELLESLAAQTRRPDEIVIVDGGSTDGTRDLLRACAARNPSLRIVEAGEATPGRGRNLGIEAARGEWIALTDAGNRLEPGWLEALTAEVARDPALEVVYGNYEPTVRTFLDRCAALIYVAPRTWRDGVLLRAPVIASSLLRKSVWSAVGGFPDRRAAEDLMFMETVAQRGYRTAWAPGATAWWELRPSLLGTYQRFELYSRHNVWAGRQRFWHYGVARTYAVAAAVTGLGLLLSPWFFILLPVGLLARAFKSIWTRRDGRTLQWALSPLQLAGVAGLLLVLDLATFVGWGRAVVRPPAPSPDR
jgi:glycosyltransferase involved in cell wall biosynthesis